MATKNWSFSQHLLLLFFLLLGKNLSSATPTDVNESVSSTNQSTPVIQVQLTPPSGSQEPNKSGRKIVADPIIFPRTAVNAKGDRCAITAAITKARISKFALRRKLSAKEPRPPMQKKPKAKKRIAKISIAKPPRPKPPHGPPVPSVKQERALIKYLESIDKKYSHLYYNYTLFNFAKNVGDEVDEDKEQEVQKEIEDFGTKVQETILNDFSYWKNIKNQALRREVLTWIMEGKGNFSEENSERMDKIEEDMGDGYSKTAVCPFGTKNCDCDSKEKKACVLKLDPEIEGILETSRDPDELEYYWTAWHDGINRNIKASQYAEFIELKNFESIAIGFKSNVDLWVHEYHTLSPSWSVESFRKNLADLWETVKPYYKILHAYARMKLSQYPAYKGLIKRCGPIPLHLLNNIFGQTWVNIDNITKPFPNAPSLDATPEMKRQVGLNVSYTVAALREASGLQGGFLQGYTIRKMMEVAEDAFVGMGLMPLPGNFYKNSVLEKRHDVEMTCHPTAWDMGLGKYGNDFRITMCGSVDQKDLATMHHELGHVQYSMQTAHLRYALRGSANPAFDESIGDVIAMSVNTPEHLQCVLGLNLGVKGLCDGGGNHSVTETDINYLYFQALESFVFFPFALVMDSFRYQVMEGKIKPADYNKKWWQMRKDIQGVVPPSPRPDNFFDAAAKYHVVVHQSYNRYFLSSVVQFQLYEGLCKAAGHYNPKNKNGRPLYRCDFTGCPIAGKLFGNMLKVGKSIPWTEALRRVTGQRRFNTEPMLRYFKPMFDKLKELLKEGREDDCLKKEWS